ncbi:MAG: M48 family metallopeptidase [Spirochaetia bacterium]|nr:M48 family metallopeptidase [Spirochaetia bacterium]
MNYKATLYSEQFTDGKVSVELQLFHGDLLIARHDSGSVEFDLKNAKLVAGGFDNNMLYIYPDHNVTSPAILVQDLSLLKEISASSNEIVRQKAMQATGIQKKKKFNKIAGIILIIVFFSGLMSIAFTQSAGIIVKLIPVKWDEKIGELGYPSAIASMAPGSTKIEDKYVLQSIEEIKNRLSVSLKNTPFKYNITVLKSPVENAFALPGGKIVIFTGILLKVDSPEELAGILAHEIMHVEKRHAMKQIVSRMGLSVLFQVIVGDMADAGSVILEVGSELLSLGYSRNMETEADKEGIILLSNAGIPADGMIQFFKKMSENEKELKSMSWLLTHPLSEKRADELAKIYKKYPPLNVKKFSTNWKILKSHLK